EGALHRMVTTEAFDGGHLPAVGLHGEHGAALHPLRQPIRTAHQHRAGTAVTGVAAHHRADLAELVAQVVDEKCSGRHVVFIPRAVDSDRDPRHGSSRGYGPRPGTAGLPAPRAQTTMPTVNRFRPRAARESRD